MPDVFSKMLGQNMKILNQIDETRKIFLEIENPSGYEVACDAVLEMAREEILKLKETIERLEKDDKRSA